MTPVSSGHKASEGESAGSAQQCVTRHLSFLQPMLCIWASWGMVKTVWGMVETEGSGLALVLSPLSHKNNTQIGGEKGETYPSPCTPQGLASPWLFGSGDVFTKQVSLSFRSVRPFSLDIFLLK